MVTAGYDGGKEGSPSEIISSNLCPIAPPIEVAATKNIFTDKIQLSFSSVLFSEIYKIYRSDDEGSSYTWIDSTSDTTFDDTTVVRGKRYYYKITAFKDSCDETLRSERVDGYVQSEWGGFTWGVDKWE